MRVVSIDVGIRHLAFVDVTCGKSTPIAILHGVHLVDLCCLSHARVHRHACTLHHTKELGDRLAHFKQEYGYIFDRADVVLVERQPITGLQSVQMFFHQSYREKVSLLSPNSMHKFFNLSRSYNHRKVQVVALMKTMCKHLRFDIDKACVGMPRLHDVADALCFAWWWGYRQQKKIESPYFRPLRIAELQKAFPNLQRFIFRKN
jgi:hypothetical protein